jgi:hypothetical protein
MRLLLFLARIAFIFNLFFLACLIFRYNDIVTDQSLEGFVIVVGWLIAPISNFIFVAIYLIGNLLRKIPAGKLPGWLVIFNLVLMILQLVILIYI